MNPAILSPGNNLVITFLASFLIWFMVAGVVFMWLTNSKIKVQHIMSIFLATLVAFIISEVIKRLFPTIRPYEVTGGVPLTLTIPRDPSFPSEHTSLAFALAAGIRKFGKTIFYVYLLFAILVGFGRFLSHVHYYADIVTGALIGVASVLLIEKTKAFKFLS